MSDHKSAQCELQFYLCTSLTASRRGDKGVSQHVFYKENSRGRKQGQRSRAQVE